MLTGMQKAAKNGQKSKKLLPKFQKLLSKFLDFFLNINVNFKKALISALTIIVSISQEK